MQNPFMTTFSKAPVYTYIPTEQADTIIEELGYEFPTESVYKITGVRGSGKTVILAKIEEFYLQAAKNKDEWLVYRLSPSRDMLLQLAARLHKEKFVEHEPSSRSISVSASVLGTGEGFGISSTRDKAFFDIGAELEEMLVYAQKNQKKILIGIDEVSKTDDMIKFASEFGKWLRAGYPVYLVCTGLYENIQELSNVKNLTFFRRALNIKTTPLNIVAMSEVYKNTLEIPRETAVKLAKITRGYAYAFQQLGATCFKGKNTETISESIEKMKGELFAYSYEKIWEELSEGDRSFLKAIVDKSEYTREEIIQKMGDKSGNYSVYRDRMLKRGLINAGNSTVSLALPFFGEYIKVYCCD